MSKALALALACHGVAAWTASDASIRSAVRLWLSDKSAAEVKYGHISTWETGGVTDMDFLFCVRTDWIDAEYEDEDNFLDPLHPACFQHRRRPSTTASARGTPPV